MAIVKHEIGSAAVSGAGHSPLAVQSFSTRGIGKMTGTPNVIQFDGADDLQTRDYRPPGAILVIGKVDCLRGLLNSIYPGEADLFVSDFVQWTVKGPCVHYVTDQLPFIGIAWTGVDLYFSIVISGLTSKRGREHLPPNWVVAPWNIPIIVIRIHDHGQPHLMKIVEAFGLSSSLLRFAQCG